MSEPLTTLVAISEPVLSSAESAVEVSVDAEPVDDSPLVGVPEPGGDPLVAGEPGAFDEVAHPGAAALKRPARVRLDIDACKLIRMGFS